MNSLGMALKKAAEGRRTVTAKMIRGEVLPQLVRAATYKQFGVEAAIEAAGCTGIAVFDDRNPDGSRPLRAGKRINARLWGKALISEVKGALRDGSFAVKGTELQVYLVHPEIQVIEAIFA